MHPDQGDSSSPFSRNEAVQRILELETEIEAFENRSDQSSRRRLRLLDLGRKTALYAIFGKGLTRSFGELLQAVKEQRRPYLGKELAKTLDMASRKLIGYKRWLLILGLLAATPGIVSMILLWQQNLTVAKSKDDKISDLDNFERVILLTTIYNTYDKSEAGMLTTPVSSPVNRRDAVLRLIERDALELAATTEQDLLNTNRMVDLSLAPLKEVDFSPLPGKNPTRFKDIGFVNSDFEDASFAQCRFEHVWFSYAYLTRTSFRNAQFVDTAFDNASIREADFTGAVFENCDFTGATFDAATVWPETFDAIAAGATLVNVE